MYTCYDPNFFKHMVVRGFISTCINQLCIPGPRYCARMECVGACNDFSRHDITQVVPRPMILPMSPARD